MRLYDEVIHESLHLLETQSGKKLRTEAAGSWKDTGKESMILRSEMAYELGGDNLPAIGSQMLTADAALVSGDEIWLYGKDLPQIRKNTAFARLALVRVKEDIMGEGDALYNQIRRLEYTKYHMYPEGYMMRISAASEREMVRIGKDALRKGLDFEKIGNMFLRAYHKNPAVEAVKLIFLTMEDFPYRELERQVRKAEQITRAIDHILKDIAMNCQSCSLKQICDEVEGMRELHFGAVQAQ